MKRYWGLMLVCLLLTVPLFGIAAGFSQSAGGGKHFIGANLFFPYGFLVGHLFPNGPWPFVALMVMMLFAQLPVYAAILAQAWERNRMLSRIMPLLLIHALAACACFLVQWQDERK